MENALQSKVLGGVLLVAGTTIGAAMLALPISTGLAGFIPAQILFLVYWAYMTYTAFLILEVNLRMEGDVDMITMADRTLGRAGKLLAWASYLFLLYSLTTAYLSVSGGVFLDAMEAVLGWQVPGWLGPLPLLCMFSYFVYRGAAAADRLNRILMAVMALIFVFLLVRLTPEVQLDLLSRCDWRYSLLGVSVVATSFGFHIIIPTLTAYLKRNVRELNRVLIIGSLIPIVVYTLWQLVTLGSIPVNGPVSLTMGYEEGLNSASLLAQLLHSPTLQLLARVFTFLAVMTSFLGVSLSLWHCLKDGFKLTDEGKGSAFLYIMTFAPPLCFALTSPRAFLTALEYAGAFGVVVLLGLLPACMVWSAREHQEGAGRGYRIPGGKPALVAVILLSLIVIGVELLTKTGVLQQWVL